jgi:hypothetical protein
LPEWLHPHPGLALRPVDAQPLGPAQIVIGLEGGGEIILDDRWWRGSRS